MIPEDGGDFGIYTEAEILKSINDLLQLLSKPGIQIEIPADFVKTHVWTKNFSSNTEILASLKNLGPKAQIRAQHSRLPQQFLHFVIERSHIISMTIVFERDLDFDEYEFRCII